MKLSKFRNLNFFNIVLFTLAFIQYYLLSSLNVPAETFINTVIPYDTKIKLIPGFIIFYMSIYVMIGYLLLLTVRKKSASDMATLLLSFIFLWSIINLGHALFYTPNFIRPQIKDTGFFFDSVNWLYTSVKPFRTLPDWHVATAILCTLAFVKLKLVKKYYFIIAWCVMICLSPVFLKMTYLIDVIISIPLAFLTYQLIGKVSTVKMKTETVQEIVKAFTIESLVQSVAIGIRDESTLSSLIEGLVRIEKNLTEKDKEEIKEVGSKFNPPVLTLKEIINNLISSLNVERHVEKAREMFGKGEKSYTPTDKDLKTATEELIGQACIPFDNAKFRYIILEIKKRNAQIINTSSIEEAAKERSHDIIFRFKSFVESHRQDIPIIKAIMSNTNGHLKADFDDVKIISRELRKPPYEISPDEVWNAFYRVDSANVKPLNEQKNPANIITLTQYALGKIDRLEPFIDKVDRKFDDWILENKSNGKVFSEIEMEWLRMMKTHVASFLEINMTSFNEPPFVNKGGAAKAYNIFGHDLNRILFEMNEKLL